MCKYLHIKCHDACNLFLNVSKESMCVKRRSKYEKCYHLVWIEVKGEPEVRYTVFPSVYGSLKFFKIKMGGFCALKTVHKDLTQQVHLENIQEKKY